MTLKARKQAFNAFIELIHPEHSTACTINACGCPQSDFNSAVRLAWLAQP